MIESLPTKLMKIYTHHHMDHVNLESDINFKKLPDYHLNHLKFETMHLTVDFCIPFLRLS